MKKNFQVECLREFSYIDDDRSILIVGYILYKILNKSDYFFKSPLDLTGIIYSFLLNIKASKLGRLLKLVSIEKDLVPE